MRDKIYSIVLSAIFVILLVWCPTAYFLDKAEIIKLPENKNIKVPEKVYDRSGALYSVLNSIEEGKANLDNIYSNCLPMYENITVFMLDGERSMNHFLLETVYNFESAKPISNTAVVPENDPGTSPENPVGEETTEPATESGKIKYKAKRIGTDWENKVWAFAEEGQPYSTGWTDKTLLADEAELRRRVNMQTAHINRIANANKDVNVYVYVCTRFQETEIFGEIIKDIQIMRNEFSTYGLMMEFFDKLDMTVIKGADYFKIDALDLRLERICKTDHHEAAQGGYSIYSDIITMMAKDTPVLGAPREVTWHVIDGLELRGSHVWNHGYTEIHDDWHYYKADLPENRVLYEWIDEKGPTQKQVERYESGRYAKDTFADHYYQFWTRIANAYYPSNNTGRNLLMITDSYSWAVSELLTSHFDRSYATYPSFREHWSLNYNEFIRDNNITDVVIFHVGDRILFDIQNDIQFDRTITD